MLVKEGYKKSYILGGIFQIILGIASFFLFFPLILSSFGVTVQTWFDLSANLQTLPVVSIIIDALYIVLFLFNFFALFARRSFSSTFFKLSALVAMAPFVMLATDGILDSIFGKNLGLINFIVDGVLYPLIIVSGICFVLGFIFQFTFSHNSANKATTYQMAKAIVWIALFVINFMLNTESLPVQVATIFNATVMFSWYFLIMGVWQIISSPKLVDPYKQDINTGTPMGGSYGPQGYIQPQPYGGQPYPPQYQNYNYNHPPQGYNPYGYRQGLADENGNIQSETQNLSNLNAQSFDDLNTQNTQNSNNFSQPETSVSFPEFPVEKAGGKVVFPDLPEEKSEPSTSSSQPISEETHKLPTELPKKLPQKSPLTLPKKLPPKLQEKIDANEKAEAKKEDVKEVVKDSINSAPTLSLGGEEKMPSKKPAVRKVSTKTTTTKTGDDSNKTGDEK